MWAKATVGRLAQRVKHQLSGLRYSSVLGGTFEEGGGREYVFASLPWRLLRMLFRGV